MESWNQRLFQTHLRTRRFGQELVYFLELDSTNRWLEEGYRIYPLNGTVVVANHQTDGKGRQGKVWFDKSSSALLFSVLLRHSLDDTAVGFLSFLPAISIIRALSSFISPAYKILLKWPNDVLLNHRKIAGILGVNLHNEEKRISIIGVGVNLTTMKEDFPDVIQNLATSIFEETGVVIQKEVLLAEILYEWEKLYDNLVEGKTEDIRTIWCQNSFPMGTRITRIEHDKKFTGRFSGLGEKGQLLLKDDSDRIHEFYSGEISIES
jgi:BirA family transcriptional regulator, biotin operon repressor / biotin---[acetyl-CoA-carboxylase] ligase